MRCLRACASTSIYEWNMSRVAQAPQMRTSTDKLNTQYAHVCSRMLTHAAGVECGTRAAANGYAELQSNRHAQDAAFGQGSSLVASP
jgi:hypothetical protein